MSPPLKRCKVNVPLCDHVNFGPPFDDSDADIILRSCFTSALAPGKTEAVATDFLVHKLFLIKASSVFESLLSSSSKTLDQQNAEALKHGINCDIRGNLPVLCLSEDRDTVQHLLTIIYHIDIVYPQTLEIIKTLAAARKYGMPSVIAVLQTYRSRVAPVAATGVAFRAYVFALNQGLKEEALEAAQLTLSLPQIFENYGSSLCNASGFALHALWKCRVMTAQAIKRGVCLCWKEVGDLRDWKVNLPEKIPQDFSTMNFSDFVNTMSTQEGYKCRCDRQQRLDHARLFDCLERHVRGQIEQMHDEFLPLFDDLGEEVIPPSGQPRKFGAPFDHGDSDITIRSCDCVDFHVHKVILRIASVTFEEMFTAPGPAPPGDGRTKQVINPTENSKILRQLLSAMYPMDLIIPDTLEDALSLVSACQKYQMDTPVNRIRALIRACTPPIFTAENSFRAYGIASRYHLEEEALHAARLTLELPMDFNTIGEDLRFTSGADLFRLYGYRNECIKVAKECIEKTINHKPPIPLSSSCPYFYKQDDSKEYKSAPRWWHSHYLLRIADRPSPRTVTDRPALRCARKFHLEKTHCSTCMHEDDKECCTNLKVQKSEAKLRKAIEQVRLDV